MHMVCNSTVAIISVKHDKSFTLLDEEFSFVVSRKWSAIDIWVNKLGSEINGATAAIIYVRTQFVKVPSSSQATVVTASHNFYCSSPILFTIFLFEKFLFTCQLSQYFSFL